MLAQEEEEDYFGSEISDAKHVIKWNILALAHGHLECGYEYFLNDDFSFEIGGGYQLPYYIGENLNWGAESALVFNPNNGYSFMAGFKYFMYGYPNNGTAIALHQRTRFYNEPEFVGANFAEEFTSIEKVRFLDFYGAFHYQHLLNSTIYSETVLGYGIRVSEINYSFQNEDLVGNDFAFIIPISFKIGVNF